MRCVPPYSNISKKSLWCLYEKREIVAYQNQKVLLNERSELLRKSRHANKFLLKKNTDNDFRYLAVVSSREKLIVFVAMYYFIISFKSKVKSKLLLPDVCIYIYIYMLNKMWKIHKSSIRSAMKCINSWESNVLFLFLFLPWFFIILLGVCW